MSMTISLADNPKVTFALYKLEDLLAEQRQNPHPDFHNITTHKDQVLARYQPMFSERYLPRLSSAEFLSFLSFDNNHHWSNWQRIGPGITKDMDLLRAALLILVDETCPVQDRLNELRPDRYWGEHSLVSYLGMPVLTAILQVTQPDLYGVWNDTSDAGLKTVRLWEKRWETQPAGDSYVEMNEIYLYLAQALGIDLWTLDALWWVMKK